MATFTAIANGNWNDWATWFAGDPGGGEGSQYPGNGDVADCAGFAVTMNLTTTPATGTLAEMKSTGAGYFIWDNTAGGAMVVNCTKFTVGGTGAGTGGVFRHTATTAGYSLTVNSSQTSGEGLIGATGGTNPYGFTRTGDENFTFKGRITGGTTAAGRGLTIGNAIGSVRIEGNIYGGSYSTAYGMTINSATTIDIYCTEIAGNTAPAIYQTAPVNYTMNIYPLAPATSYSIKGGATAVAMQNPTTTAPTITLNDDVYIDESSGGSFAGPIPTWVPAADNLIMFGDDKFAKLVAAADLKSGVVNGDVTGTYKGGAGARMKQIGIGVF